VCVPYRLGRNSSQLESEHRSGYQAFAENQRWERDLVEAIPWIRTLPSKNGVATDS